MDKELNNLRKELYRLDKERDRLLRQIKIRENHYLNPDKKKLWLENQLLRHQLEQFQAREIKFEEQNQKLQISRRSRLFDW